MIENNPSNVSSGFEMLLEEVEAEIDFFTRIGARAFESRDFRKVDEARAQAEQVTAFRDKVAALRKEWDAISGAETEQDEETKAERRNLGRLRKGLRTPESAYYLPILTALNELGGSAKIQTVLEKVYETMKPVRQKIAITSPSVRSGACPPDWWTCRRVLPDAAAPATVAVRFDNGSPVRSVIDRTKKVGVGGSSRAGRDPGPACSVSESVAHFGRTAKGNPLAPPRGIEPRFPG